MQTDHSQGVVSPEAGIPDSVVPVSRPAGSGRRRGDGWALVVAAVLLIGLALPLTVREGLLLPYATVIEGVSTGAPLDVQNLQDLHGTLQALTVLPPSGRIERLAARVERRRFEMQGGIDALTRAARLTPGDSTVWMQLAMSLPPGEKAARALRLSALTNAFEFDATPRRVDLGLRLWRYMDAEDRAAFGRLVLALWDWEQGRLGMITARYEAYDQIAPYLQAARADWTVLPGSYAIHRLNPVTPYPYGGR